MVQSVLTLAPPWCCGLLSSALQVGKFHEENHEPLAIPEGTGDEARH